MTAAAACQVHAGENEPVECFCGRETGLQVPMDPEALGEAGAEFLTRAFRAFGSIPAEVRVLEIREIVECNAGSSGRKAFVTVEYEGRGHVAPTRLFAKFSRALDDAFRDRRRYELEAEIRIAKLARHPRFPIKVPRAVFADMDVNTGSGLLVTERIPYGSGGVEDFIPKCMDHGREDALERYRAIVIALADLACAQRSGRLSPDVETLFPLDMEAARQEDQAGWDEAQVTDFVDRYREFVRVCPQLIPEKFRGRFVDDFGRQATNLLRRQHRTWERLYADPRLIALSHYNANVDNAWFWRNRSGELECGLMDWQRARQMNVAAALWGSLCGAGQDIWENNLDELLDLFVDHYGTQGGARIGRALLKDHLCLYAGLIGLAGLVGVPAMLLDKYPEITAAKDTADPVLVSNESARSFLHVFTVLLNVWASDEFQNVNGFSGGPDQLAS